MPDFTPPAVPTTARKAQVAGGAGFLAPLFILVPCSASAVGCTDSIAAGFLLIQEGFYRVGLGAAPDPAMLHSAINVVVMATVTGVLAFVGTYFTTNKAKG